MNAAMIASRNAGKLAVIGVPYLWLLIFFLLPFLIIVKISVSEMGAVSVNDLVTYKDGVLALSPRLGNYATVVQDDLYFDTYLSSLKYAAVTTVLCVAIGYPFAYFMARARATVQPALLMLVMLPFWTSFLLRVYAWKGLLTEHGWLFDLITASGLDRLLAAANLIPAPGQLMNTPFSLVLGMTYMYLPFMILPLYSNLSKMDLRLLEAASDLGATAWVAFVGEFVVPELLGGPQTQMIGRTLWDEFFSNNDWPIASTVAVVMILLIIVPLALFNKYQAEATESRS